ncbi:MAG: fibronectin type III domain-containing protein [Deltaproteobacteria bacterium]|nr:fibronectin type III domain-containing protein [Deltaproteobacteria bacterium]
MTAQNICSNRFSSLLRFPPSLTKRAMGGVKPAESANGANLAQSVTLTILKNLFLSLILAIITLSGCGGGGGGSSTSPPSAPTGVSASAGAGQVTISWTAATGATSYNVYWSTASGVTKTTGAQITDAASPYTHSGLTNGTTYYYVVTAVNSYGESSESSEVSATPGSGTLDAAFGAGGKVTTAIGTSHDNAGAVAIQSDGKIVAAGSSSNGNGVDYDFALVRYDTNGALDAAFGAGGKVTSAIGTSDDYAFAVAIQSDGNIVAAGGSWNGAGIRATPDFALARYNTDGALDAAFGAGGKGRQGNDRDRNG